MALIFAVVIGVLLFNVQPMLGVLFGILSMFYFYKMFKRTSYMTNDEVDTALSMRSSNPHERRNIRADLKSRIDARMTD